LATLGGTTQIGSFLFYAAPPKVAKASKEGISRALSLISIGEGYGNNTGNSDTKQ
jgi:hypothetical protein